MDVSQSKICSQPNCGVVANFNTCKQCNKNYCEQHFIKQLEVCCNHVFYCKRLGCTAIGMYYCKMCNALYCSTHYVKDSQTCIYHSHLVYCRHPGCSVAGTFICGKCEKLYCEKHFSKQNGVCLEDMAIKPPIEETESAVCNHPNCESVGPWKCSECNFHYCHPHYNQSVGKCTLCVSNPVSLDKPPEKETEFCKHPHCLINANYTCVQCHNRFCHLHFVQNSGKCIQHATLPDVAGPVCSAIGCFDVDIPMTTCQYCGRWFCNNHIDVLTKTCVDLQCMAKRSKKLECCVYACTNVPTRQCKYCKEWHCEKHMVQGKDECKTITCLMNRPLKQNEEKMTDPYLACFSDNCNKEAIHRCIHCEHYFCSSHISCGKECYMDDCREQRSEKEMEKKVEERLEQECAAYNCHYGAAAECQHCRKSYCHDHMNKANKQCYMSYCINARHTEKMTDLIPSDNPWQQSVDKFEMQMLRAENEVMKNAILLLYSVVEEVFQSISMEQLVDNREAFHAVVRPRLNNILERARKES